MTVRQRVAVMVVVVSVGVFGFMVAAGAQELAVDPMIVSVPIDNVVFGNEGDLVEARDPVSAAELGAEVGWVCDVDLRGENPGSVNPLNDQILSTNGQSLVAPDFEEFTGKITEVSAVMILGEFVTFHTLLGPLGQSSGGLTATFDCSPNTTTTTTTTTVPETGTTVPDTTTSSIPTGVPSGLGPVEDGLSPLTTWAMLIGASMLAVLLGWALIHGGNRRQDDE